MPRSPVDVSYRARGGAAAVLVVATLSACSSSPGPSGAGTTPTLSSGAAELSLLALGDSIASGDESRSDASYPQQYADLLEKQTSRTVSVKNLADPTETSASLLSKVQSSDDVRTAISAADIVTITVGGNDSDPFADHGSNACSPSSEIRACLRDYAPELEANLDQILSEIETLRHGTPTAVRLTSPDYDPFIGVTSIDGVPPFTNKFGLNFYRQAAAAMTDAACRVARAHHADCADFFHVFNGSKGDQSATAYLADDHLHPSEKGRQAIADVLMATGISPLT